MKKRYIAALTLALAVGMLTGCGDTGSQPSSPVSGLDPKPIIESQKPEESKEPEQQIPDTEDTFIKGGEKHPITERKEVKGQKQSWLTGEWKDAKVVDRRNIAVMINNIQVSLPQYGISKASIVYEAPVEGGITRFMGLFEDYDDLDHIGSVRSSRDYFIYEAMAYDSIYCNWGLARPWVEELINSDRIDNVSQAVAGIYNGAPEAFDRIARPGVATEHTGYMFIDGFNSALKRLGYETKYRKTFKKVFEFADEGYLATYDDCKDVTKIYPGGTQSNGGGYGKHNPCFEYNPEDRLYYRTQYGQKHIDEMTGEQLAVTNVVFKVTQVEPRELNGEITSYLWVNTHGSGDAYIFTNGKMIEGTWRRDGDTEPNLFFDKYGNEIVLNQGKTWICCIGTKYADCMSWE